MTCPLLCRFCALVILGCGFLSADEVPPEVDDASLASVFFTTATDGCAVGNRGAIWLTRDGGANWDLKESPVPGLHRSVTFVNRKTGWIVGSSTMPGNQLPLGYVLQTTDAGETWKLIAGRPQRDPKSPAVGIKYLPRLRAVRFFTPTTGFAVGASNRFFPSGVLKTVDGGLNWEPVAGDEGSWRCGWFMNPDTGFVAGRLTSRATMQGDKMVQAPNQSGGLQTWRSLRVSSTNPSWMVGDGANLLYSGDGGISWQDPPQALPRSLRDFCDFHTVATYQKKVWIAGSPGSVIWHSPDGGRSWVTQKTEQSAAIRAVYFRGENNGWAVGDLGTVLRTVDGGKVWTAVKGGDRRVALMAMSPRALRVPFEVVAKQTAEFGYRSAVFLPVRPDIGPDGTTALDCEDRMHEAMAAASGCVAEYGWRFPAAISGVEQVDSQLVQDWQRRSEGKLGQTLLSLLVARIRTLRPSVVVIDEAGANDAAARVLNAAILRAVTMAGDPGHFVEHIRDAGLEPWEVQRVYQRTPDNSRAQIEIAAHDILRLRGSSVSDFSQPAYTLIAGESTSQSSQVGFRRVFPPITQGKTRADFFRGISIAHGSAARRAAVPYSETNVEQLTEIVKRQQQMAGYADKFLGDDRIASQLIAQLDELTRDLPDDAAARQLRMLADKYAAVEKWKLAAATMSDLVKRYPRTTEASAAREWLIAWWSGAEPIWQRLRGASVAGGVQLAGANLAGGAGGQIIHPAQHADYANRAADASIPKSFNPGDVTDARTDAHGGLLNNWRKSALKTSEDLKVADPLRFESSRVQLSLAALLRSRGNRSGAMAIYTNQHHEAAWKNAAANEVWADQMVTQRPKSVVTMRRTSEPPQLDGILSDPCWQQATELWLRGKRLDTAQGSSAAMAYDDEYLYLAAAVRRHESTSGVKTQRGKRSYDADLGQHDRITWCIDTDRDYSTWYRLQVDQRGFTTDACWLDQNWNPKWFVASSSDETHWRFEAAIPLDELVRIKPNQQDSWAVGVSRVLPGYGVSGWNQPAASRDQPANFGLAVFGR